MATVTIDINGRPYQVGCADGQEELQKMWILRKIIHPMGEIDAMEFLINKLAMTKTNDEFFDMMKRS